MFEPYQPADVPTPPIGGAESAMNQATHRRRRLVILRSVIGAATTLALATAVLIGLDSQHTNPVFTTEPAAPTCTSPSSRLAAPTGPSTDKDTDMRLASVAAATAIALTACAPSVATPSATTPPPATNSSSPTTSGDAASPTNPAKTPARTGPTGSSKPSASSSPRTEAPSSPVTTTTKPAKLTWMDMLAHGDLPDGDRFEGEAYDLRYSWTERSYCQEPDTGGALESMKWTYSKQIEGWGRTSVTEFGDTQTAERMLQRAKDNIAGCLTTLRNDPTKLVAKTVRQDVPASGGGALWSWGSTCRDGCDYDNRVVAVGRVGSRLVYIDFSNMYTKNVDYLTGGSHAFKMALLRAD